MRPLCRGPREGITAPRPHLPRSLLQFFLPPCWYLWKRKKQGCLSPVLLDSSISAPPVSLSNRTGMPLRPVSGGARFGVGGTQPLMGQLSSIPTSWGPRFPHESGPVNTLLSPELGWRGPCVPANRCACSVSINPLPQGVPTPPALGPGAGGQV